MASLPRFGLVNTILVGVFGPAVDFLVRGATIVRRAVTVVLVGDGVRRFD